MTNTRRALHLTGTSTNALYFGGKTPGPSLANTEVWNGSSWTEVADLNTAREANGGAEFIQQLYAMVVSIHLIIKQTQNLGMDCMGRI